MQYFSFIEEKKQDLQEQIREINDKIDELDDFTSSYDDMLSDIHRELRDALEEIATDKVESLLEEYNIEDTVYNEKAGEVLEQLLMEFNI